MSQGLVQKNKGKSADQVYLKALPFRSIEELPDIKKNIASNFIVILRITPLAQRNTKELKKAVEELYAYTASIGGDIARLGEERIVVTPPSVRIWRGLI